MIPWWKLLGSRDIAKSVLYLAAIVSSSFVYGASFGRSGSGLVIFGITGSTVATCFYGIRGFMRLHDEWWQRRKRLERAHAELLSLLATRSMRRGAYR